MAKTKNDEALHAEVWYASILQWVRKRRNAKGLKNTLVFFGIIYIVPAIIVTIIDLIFNKNSSFDPWIYYIFVYIRALLLLCMVATAWFMIYLVIGAYVDKMRREDPDYQTLRERSALKIRKYTVIIGLVFLFALCLITVSSTTTYTVVLSLIIASGLMLVAYGRSTERERRLMAMGIPDRREKAYDEQMQIIQRQNAEKAAQKARKKEERNKKRNRYLRDSN